MKAEAGANSKHVVVMRVDHRGDRDEGVAARPVLDHHRLTPLGRQLVGKHARGDVDAGAGTERNNELDRIVAASRVCADAGAAVDTSAAKPQRIKARIERRRLSMIYSP